MLDWCLDVGRPDSELPGTCVVLYIGRHDFGPHLAEGQRLGRHPERILRLVCMEGEEWDPCSWQVRADKRRPSLVCQRPGAVENENENK